MPTLDPAPGAEDIDEHAAGRSSRVTLIAMSALVLFSALAGMLVFLIFRQVDSRPAGVHDSVPVWAVVLLVASVGIVLASTLWWARRQYRRPVYRRVMQYGWRRRRRVVKDLRRGRPLPAEDMPVASALVELLHSQRWLVVLYGLMPVNFVFQGLVQQGFLRWLDFGLAACWLVFMPFFLRQRRQIIRNYERQNTATVENPT